MIKLAKKIKYFFKKEIWQYGDDISSVKKFIYKFLQILVYSVRGYKLDKCGVHASSLTFFSILSVVPTIALSFGIAKNFGLENAIERAVRKNLAGHTEVVDYVVEFSNSMIVNAKGGVIAAISMLVLFWSVIKLLNHIEIAFNEMWNVTQERKFFRKIRNYISMIVLTPIAIIISLSITVFISKYIKDSAESYEVVKFATPLIISLLKFVPYLLLWGLFIMIYYRMPHAKVSFKSALLAGIIAGSMYQAIQWGYINFHIGMGKMNKIYGSFAALPLFLIWVRLSWMLILFGGEISYAFEKHLFNDD